MLVCLNGVACAVRHAGAFVLQCMQPLHSVSQAYAAMFVARGLCLCVTLQKDGVATRERTNDQSGFFVHVHTFSLYNQRVGIARGVVCVCICWRERALACPTLRLALQRMALSERQR